MPIDRASSPSPHVAEAVWVVLLGLAGVLISYAYFIPSTLEYGFLESWAAAFASHPHSLGLHWDLIFSDLIVISLAVIERERIGTRSMLGTIAMGLTLGVCAAIPVYWLGLRAARRVA